MSKDVVPQKWCMDIELKIPMSCILMKQIKCVSFFLKLLGKDTRFDLSSYRCITSIVHDLNLLFQSQQGTQLASKGSKFNLIDGKIQNCNCTFQQKNNLGSSLRFILPIRCIIMKILVVNCEMKSSSMLNTWRYRHTIAAFHFFDNGIA